MQFQASAHMKFLLLSILLLHFQSSVTAKEPVFAVCGSTNYTSGSRYETNLNTILSNLSTNGVIRRESLYNTTYGDDANTVYGFSQCMSAASEEDCRQCLVNSTAEIIRRCPNRTEATIRYYNCILRYSNLPFFSELDSDTRFVAYMLANVTNTLVFNTQLGGLMDGLSSAAALATSKYAVNEANYTNFNKIYGLAQCTRDLSQFECNRCLRNMIGEIPNCCNGRTGGNVYSVSCNIRYETYAFFDMSSSSPPPLSSSSPPPLFAAPPTLVESPDINPTQNAGVSGTSNSMSICKSLLHLIPLVYVLW